MQAVQVFDWLLRCNVRQHHHRDKEQMNKLGWTMVWTFCKYIIWPQTVNNFHRKCFYWVATSWHNAKRYLEAAWIQSKSMQEDSGDEQMQMCSRHREFRWKHICQSWKWHQQLVVIWVVWLHEYTETTDCIKRDSRRERVITEIRDTGVPGLSEYDTWCIYLICLFAVRIPTQSWCLLLQQTSFGKVVHCLWTKNNPVVKAKFAFEIWKLAKWKYLADTTNQSSALQCTLFLKV